MRRRDFIYNSGLLLPALLASPSLLMASAKTINSSLLIIHDEDTIPAAVAEMVNGFGTTTQLEGKKITRLRYTNNGFQVTTSDNLTFVTQKLLVHTKHRINTQQNTVEVQVGNKTFPLAYLTQTANKVTPECWFVNKKQLHTEKLAPFINRNRHAVLCLSGC
ncbi:hypothetical protein A3860_24730 [Niastella vici]|uniref:Uncharacterized protein n=1 Tax=Niastella vici TaxID=1703345 RepID=A0A1V9FYV2_9BACT|nr:hypothetical protein [Niastella vici]OQP63549.1 hypothetical protein A3860_24730 [Niastella vici]